MIIDSKYLLVQYKGKVHVASWAGIGLGKLTTSVRMGRIVVASTGLTGKITWPVFCAIETSGGDLWASLVI